jgi:uncharacterized membrane protein YhaH (DUF805 family)
MRCDCGYDFATKQIDKAYLNKKWFTLGRMNRAQFFWAWLAFFAIPGFFYTGLVPIKSGEIATIIGVISFAVNVIFIFQAVKRLHDLGRPGTHYWLMLIPFYNIYLACLLFFKKGTEGPNEYGPDLLATALPKN